MGWDTYNPAATKTPPMQAKRSPITDTIGLEEALHGRTEEPVLRQYLDEIKGRPK